MAQRRGWRAGPTDTEGDAAELRHTEAVGVPQDFDTPPVSEVLQGEVDAPGGETGMPDEPIPVRLVTPVNVNQLPTRVGGMFSKRLAAAPARAVKVLNADPRRAAVTISVDGVAARIGRTQAEADDDSAFVCWVSQGPYRFHFTEELWARADTATVRVSVVVEQWAR